VVQWLPVEPNPPAPRSLSLLNSATMLSSACSTGTNIIWQIRSPGAIVYGAAPPQLTSLPDDPTWFAPSSEETAPGVTANDRAATRLPPAQPE